MATSASLPSDLAQSAQRAFQHIDSGQMTLIDLFQLTHELNLAGRAETAIRLYRAWLAKNPGGLAYAAYFNLAILLTAQDDPAGAEAAYRSALLVNPRFSEGHLNLGTLLERQKRPDEALDAWRVVLGYADPALPAERPLLIQALNNLGRLLELQRDFPAAEDMLTRSLQLNPEQPDVITHWVHLRQKQCKWPVFSSDASGVPVRELMTATSALGMLSGSGDPADQLASAQRFARDKVIHDVPQLTGPAGYEHSRLRVGYLSSDFCSHAVSILTAELYGLHDRNRVEVYGFDWSNDDGSQLRARVLAGFDHHVRIHALSDEEAARLIRSHEIDVLVDLHGLTLGARPNILSYRPAPVQVTWLGLPGTTALPQIDYVISDSFVLPPELEPFFTEKPLHMPRTFQINDRQRRIGERPTREACGLPPDAFVFCAFNNSFKITPDVFQAWMRMLQRVPDSVLWLVGDNEQVRVNLSRQAELAGVDAGRLVFGGRALPADYLARFQVADLFLDTIPFNGGTTASDALWAGLPVLTIAGRTFSARMAGSLLNAVDLPELITYSLQEYEDKGVSLAQDRLRVEAMKRQLVENRLSCALFDTPRFVRELEDAFERVALGKRVAGAADSTAARRPGLPLVSVLVPAADGCSSDTLLESLGSALAQDWANTEIIISDSTTDETVTQALAPLLARHARLRHLRAPGLDAAATLQHAYKFAQGSFVACLPPGELFHPQKLQHMMGYMMAEPGIGLAVSWSQQVDADGNFVAPASGGGPLYATQTRIGGQSLAELMLANGQTITTGLGTVLFRKAMAGPRFGEFLGRQYSALPEIASWLAVLAQGDCLYLPQALSYAPALGTPRDMAQRIAAQVEWLQMLCDAHTAGVFARNRALLHEPLTNKLVACLLFLSGAHQEIKAGAYELERIHAVLRQATNILLAP